MASPCCVAMAVCEVETLRWERCLEHAEGSSAGGRGGGWGSSSLCWYHQCASPSHWMFPSPFLPPAAWQTTVSSASETLRV